MEEIRLGQGTGCEGHTSLLFCQCLLPGIIAKVFIAKVSCVPAAVTLTPFALLRAGCQAVCLTKFWSRQGAPQTVQNWLCREV